MALFFTSFIFMCLSFILGCAGSSSLSALSLVAASTGYSLVAVDEVLVVVASLVVGLRL